MALKNLASAMNNTQALKAAAIILGSEPTPSAIANQTQCQVEQGNSALLLGENQVSGVEVKNCDVRAASRREGTGSAAPVPNPEKWSHQAIIARSNLDRSVCRNSKLRPIQGRIRGLISWRSAGMMTRLCRSWLKRCWLSFRSGGLRLGIENFISVELAHWLHKQNQSFVFRQKKNTTFQEKRQKFQPLNSIEIYPDVRQFYPNFKFTQKKAFSRFNLAVYWKTLVSKPSDINLNSWNFSTTVCKSSHLFCSNVKYIFFGKTSYLVKFVKLFLY
ncbi:hypothetical protein [Nostoc sp. C117]|uniref:hypothetical protein n=1 Tax=Nostoc sp. C117 TaxID=3349875 RepID=UPI00370D832A